MCAADAHLQRRRRAGARRLRTSQGRPPLQSQARRSCWSRRSRLITRVASAACGKGAYHYCKTCFPDGKPTYLPSATRTLGQDATPSTWQDTCRSTRSTSASRRRPQRAPRHARLTERAQARTGTGAWCRLWWHHPAPLGTHASMLRCLSEQHIPTHQAGAVGGAGSTSTARKGCEVTLVVTLRRPGAGML